jgi:uncharacterized membrane protein
MDEGTPLNKVTFNPTTETHDDEAIKKNEQDLTMGRWITVITAMLMIFKAAIDLYITLHLPKKHSFHPHGPSTLMYSMYFVFAMDIIAVLAGSLSAFERFNKSLRYIFVINFSLILCIILVWSAINGIVDAVQFRRHFGWRTIMELLGANIYSIIVCIMGVLCGTFRYIWMRKQDGMKQSGELSI